MARWAMTTLNAVECGARMGIWRSGGCFVASSIVPTRSVGVELMVWRHGLYAACTSSRQPGSRLSVIPTLCRHVKIIRQAMVMTLADPYTIVQVNSWQGQAGSLPLWPGKSCVVPSGQTEASAEMMQGSQSTSPLMTNFRRQTGTD
jgi:hypothetical protein